MHATRATRPFVILPAREEPGDLVAAHMKLVPHACEACGEITTREGLLCIDCEDRTHPHQPDDPYDVIGGEQGPE